MLYNRVMSERRKRAIKRIVFGAGLLALAGGLYLYGNRAPKAANFAECAEAGYQIMESYPRQCRTPGGQTFREDIGNELEKDDLIRIAAPRPNAQVSSPLAVKGMARGEWFFEASFPVVIVDWDGKIIGEGFVAAVGEWMTDGFAPFSGTVRFNTAEISGEYSRRGTLILKKANISGLPEHDDALEIPVIFGM